MDTLSRLNADFGHAGAIAFELIDAAPMCWLHGSGGRALVSLQGAQVLNWRHHSQGEMLWWSPLSPPGRGSAIRGGIPICWPWFGPHPTDRSQPQHGLVRTVDWSVAAAGSSSGASYLELALTHFAAGSSAELRLRVEVAARLKVELNVLNTGDNALTVTEALHTYFAVQDVGSVALAGLEGCSYRDRTASDQIRVLDGLLVVDGETNAHFDETPDRLRLIDKGRDHVIEIERLGGRSTVVWNPGPGARAMADVVLGGERGFLCVESGNIGSSAVTIPPGCSHHLGVRYSILGRM